MDSKLTKLKEVIIQIATPHSTGTGFYLKSHDLIITNEHVIRGDRTIVINNDFIDNQLAEVLFIDEKYDLAFLKAKQLGKTLDNVSIREDALEMGDQVIAMGHPFGMQFSSTSGIISNPDHKIDDVQFLQHDAALNAGNSGGPLIDLEGNIVGINTFLIANGVSMGFALPAKKMMEILNLYQSIKGQIAQRCPSCQHLISEKQLETDYCPLCGTQVYKILNWQDHIPTGIHKTIEDMLALLGFEVNLSRRGPAQWFVERGSAGINISYHEKTGLIEGDAYLVQLPDENIDQLYTFLLQENYDLEGLTFSVKTNYVVLSLLVYDQYFDIEVSSKLFKKLFETADYYDDVLVRKFNAKWGN